MSLAIEAMELGILPDFAIRFGIRKLCRERLISLEGASEEEDKKLAIEYIADLKKSPVAIHAEAANQQHYELPPAFFQLVLGVNKKYSCAYWPKDCHSLDEAEEAALSATINRAEIHDGMHILELGCGWGSLTLKMAKRFPKAKITAVSNSKPQRDFILERAHERNIFNIKVITTDIGMSSDLSEYGKFDRVVSVEMFEHMRNYEALLERISHCLKPEGKLFVHIFSHKKYSYHFETEGDDNWMGRYFFTGGQMPSHKLLTAFQKDLTLEKDWSWNGENYAKTSEAWLENMDNNREQIRAIFKETYGVKEADRWLQRWRVFFLACAELFAYKNGSEWGVSHYLFRNNK